MEYGWVDLNTAQGTSNVKTPGAVARVQQDSEAFVTVDRGSNQGRFGALRGGMELTAKGGLKREVQRAGAGGADRRPAVRAPAAARPAGADRAGGQPGPRHGAGADRGRSPGSRWTVPPATPCRSRAAISSSTTSSTSGTGRRRGRRWGCAARGRSSGGWRRIDRSGVQGPWSKPWKFRVASFRSGMGEKDTTPPALDLEDVKSYGSIFIVGGRSEPGARVEINGEQVKVGRGRLLHQDRPARQGRLELHRDPRAGQLGERDHPPASRLRRKSVNSSLALVGKGVVSPNQ